MTDSFRNKFKDEPPVEIKPPKKKGKAFALPVGFGYKLYLESRFITILVLGILVSLYGALCANEWLYLLASSFISCAILGAIIPLFLLSIIQFDYSLPSDTLSSDQAIVVVKLKRWPIFGPLTGLVPLKWLRLSINAVRRGKDGTTFEPIFSPEPVLIDNLETERWFEFPSPHLERGVYKFLGVEISTCFPLGIVWWSRKFGLKSENDILMTVYPRHYNVSGNFLEYLRGVSSTMGMATSLSAVTHQSTSFRSVREFRTGDSLRHIHWALTAKANEILVKEFDQETLPVFDLMLNLRANWQSKEQFELAVSTALSLCHLGYSMGQVPTLILNPELNSSELENLMGDLPGNINPGIEKQSEILARVEQVSLRARSKEDGDDSEDDVKFKFQERDLVAIFPTQEKVVKYTPGVGDVICSPIELAIVPQGWEYEEEFDDQKGGQNLVNFDKLRPGKSKSENVKKLMGPTTGEIIGRVEWIKDLEAL